MAAMVHLLSVAKKMLLTLYGKPSIIAVTSLVRYNIPRNSVLGVDAFSSLLVRVVPSRIMEGKVANISTLQLK